MKFMFCFVRVCSNYKVIFCYGSFEKQSESEDLMGYNYLKWCIEDGGGERNAVIVRQRMKIYNLEKFHKDSKSC